jgi:N-acetylmuramoyl-L-alanine amidase
VIDLETADAADILARTVCGEARGEGITGMHAVANVVMNRVAHPRWWGETVKGVCLKPFQFSCWTLGDPNRPVILNLDTRFSVYRSAQILAQQALAGTLPDVTNGALNYYARGTPEPKWAFGKTPCAILGNHIFFTDVG